MTARNARTVVIRADGSRVQPTVKTLPNASATKAQRRRAARVKKILGEPVTATTKQPVKPRTLTAVQIKRLKQQEHLSY